MMTIVIIRSTLALALALLVLETEAALFQSSSSQTTSFIRLRTNKLRRPDLCRESLPRRAEDLPSLVITGKVRELYLANDNGSTKGDNQQQLNSNKALININRVIKGNQRLLGTDIIVSGFNASNSSPCPNYLKQNDSLILLLNQDGDKRYSIQGSNMFSMSLSNLDRVNALAADEPVKRRPPIEDILCEAHYCPYGRCVVTNEQLGQVSCECPDMCTANYSPVCGSDNVTYSNECQLILEGCRLKKPLFVTREGAC